MKVQLLFTIINLMKAPAFSILQNSFNERLQNNAVKKETKHVSLIGNKNLRHRKVKVSKKVQEYNFMPDDTDVGESVLDSSSVGEKHILTLLQTPNSKRSLLEGTNFQKDQSGEKKSREKTEKINFGSNYPHRKIMLRTNVQKYTFTFEDTEVGMSVLDHSSAKEQNISTFLQNETSERSLLDTKNYQTDQSREKELLSLVASIESYPDYTGPLEPTGTVTIYSNSESSFLFHLDMDGLDPQCTNTSPCSVSIYNGTDCNDVGKTVLDDLEVSGSVYYTYDQGTSRSTFKVNTREAMMSFKGRVVVVKDSSDLSIGCGVMKIETLHKVLKASMGLYPGYEPGEDDPALFGSVTVSFRDDDTFDFAYDLEGLMSNCKECGIHIHAGKSCDDHDLVLGHGFNKYVVNDLWTTVGGAYYNSNDDGTANGSFNLFSGFSYEETLGHAVVIHTHDGSRIGCGVLVHDDMYLEGNVLDENLEESNVPAISSSEPTFSPSDSPYEVKDVVSGFSGDSEPKNLFGLLFLHFAQIFFVLYIFLD